MHPYHDHSAWFVYFHSVLMRPIVVYNSACVTEQRWACANNFDKICKGKTMPMHDAAVYVLCLQIGNNKTEILSNPYRSYKICSWLARYQTYEIQQRPFFLCHLLMPKSQINFFSLCRCFSVFPKWLAKNWPLNLNNANNNNKKTPLLIRDTRGKNLAEYFPLFDYQILMSISLGMTVKMDHHQVHVEKLPSIDSPVYLNETPDQ